MAAFKIHTTFTLTGRGHVLVGEIADNGKISVGDIASIQKNGATIKAMILGVEMVDKISEQVSHIGLIISMQDKEKIKDWDLKGMEIQTLAEKKNTI